MALPFAVSYAGNNVGSQSVELPSTAPSNPVNGVYYVGFATSHRGDDVLYVVPGEAYVKKSGTLVTLNVTVKFRHAQPCPYSDWKITVENPENVEVVNETKTELRDAYTAFK